jgi:hypothetical protein
LSANLEKLQKEISPALSEEIGKDWRTVGKRGIVGRISYGKTINVIG